MANKVDIKNKNKNITMCTIHAEILALYIEDAADKTYPKSF